MIAGCHNRPLPFGLRFHDATLALLRAAGFCFSANGGGGSVNAARWQSQNRKHGGNGGYKSEGTEEFFLEVWRPFKNNSLEHRKPGIKIKGQEYVQQIRIPDFPP